jgi:molybdate transport system substrate-binding protein
MLVRLLAVLGLFGAVAAAPLPAAAQQSLTVFAAASLKNALDDASAAFSKATGVKVVASYEASSALAKQIEQGAPADVFISADLAWMDYASAHKLIKPDTRFNLLGNRLVLIAPKDSKLDHVAIAKAALEKLGAWAAAEPKLAQAENVRATLAFVARNETPLGIVYATDAKIEPKVKIVGEFPDDAYPPVTYPVAETGASKNAAAARYLAFLRTSAAKAVFEKYGFSFLVKPVS